MTKRELYQVIKGNRKIDEGDAISLEEAFGCIASKWNLIEMLKGGNKYNVDFRKSFEDFLWEKFKESEMLSNTLYYIYYDMENQQFTTYELVNSCDEISNDDLIYITQMQGNKFENLRGEYETIKGYLESIGCEIAYNFDEWLDEEIKNVYIENAINLIIERLEDEIEHEQYVIDGFQP